MLKWIAILTISLGPPVLRPDGPRTIRETLDEFTIIRAHVTELSGTADFNEAQLEIEHVYCGTYASAGATFTDWSARYSLNGYEVWPALAVGHEGLWLVASGFREGEIRRTKVALGITWPVRSGVEPRYEQVLNLAKALETVWLAESTEEQLDLLKDDAQSSIPEVSIGSIIVLRESSPEELTELVGRIELPRLPLRTQLAIDESMMRVKPAEWRESKNRSALFAEWERRLTTESEAFLVIGRLDIAIQRKEIDPAVLLAMIEPIVLDREGPPSVRHRAIMVLHWIAPHQDTSQAVFDLLMPLLEDDGDHLIMTAAAGSLSKVENLEDERMARLILLRDAYLEKSLEIKDRHDPIKRIATTLDETVRRLQKSKRPDGALP